MKTFKLLTILIIVYSSVSAQRYYKLTQQYDSVAMKKLIVSNMTEGSITDSVVVHKGNGGLYRVPRSQFGTATIDSTAYRTVANSFNKAQSNINFVRNQVTTTQTGGFILNGYGRVGSLQVGGGGTSTIGSSISNRASITGSSVAYANSTISTIMSDVSNNAIGYSTSLSTASGSFTVLNMDHFKVQQSTIGAGSTVTNQSGYAVEANVIGAANNYGFRGNIPASAGRYNLYMAGTAQNYLAGNLGIGITVPTAKLHVAGEGLFTGNLTALGLTAVSGTSNSTITPGTAYIANAAGAVDIQNGTVNITTGAGTGYATLKASNVTTNRIFEFPNTSGTLALLSDIVSGGGLTLASGTYTPTASSISGPTGVTFSASNYIRVGNIVQVAGFVSCAGTNTGTNTFNFSLPVATSASQIGNGILITDFLSDPGNRGTLSSSGGGTTATINYTQISGQSGANFKFSFMYTVQ